MYCLKRLLAAEAIWGGNHDVVLPELRGQHVLALAVEDLDAIKQEAVLGGFQQAVGKQ